MEESELFFKKLKVWLESSGFTLDSFVCCDTDKGVKTYFYVKGKYKVEIKLNYDLLYNTHTNIIVNFLDCEGEIYCNDGFIGWLGRKYLITLNKPFTRTFFNEILNHFVV